MVMPLAVEPVGQALHQPAVFVADQGDAGEALSRSRSASICRPRRWAPAAASFPATSASTPRQALLPGHDASDRIDHDTTTGTGFDADGNGGGAAQLLASLQGAPAVAATDIATNGGVQSGSACDDSLVGSGAPDSMSGGGGNDTLDGGLGDDTLEGGAGNDLLIGREGADLLVGGDGNDTLDGHSGSGRYPEEYVRWDPVTETYQMVPGDTLAGGLGDDAIARCPTTSSSTRAASTPSKFSTAAPPLARVSRT